MSEVRWTLSSKADAQISNTWLSHLAAQFPWIRKQKERNADAARTKKQNEGVVQKHFYSREGGPWRKQTGVPVFPVFFNTTTTY